MGMTSPPPRPRREYVIGEKVAPAEKKMDVRPAHWVDGPNTSPKGVFRNGGNRR